VVVSIDPTVVSAKVVVSTDPTVVSAKVVVSIDPIVVVPIGASVVVCPKPTVK
jgi:hypothetical protein